MARRLADAVAELNPSADDQAQVRHTLLALLSRQTDPEMARDLIDALARLDPTIADLADWESWPCPPTQALLTTVRQHSRLPAWLSILPMLSGSSGISDAPSGASACINNG